MKFHLGYLLGFSAFIVAACAAFFSVFGLSQLFAGASTAVIIMASALEFSKLVAATFLHRYWVEISRVLRIYLTIGVIILVTITSAGIYGFLSNAYQKTATALSHHEGEVVLIDNKIDLFNQKVVRNQSLIDGKLDRAKNLTDLRTKQEVRLDSMINRRYFQNATTTREEINSANISIESLNADADKLVNENNTLNDSVGKYQLTKLELIASSDVAAEIGPLKYLSELLDKPMDIIVNYFILLLIVVFDPLAISLVIATSWVFTHKRKLINTPSTDNPEPTQPGEDEEIDIDNLEETKEEIIDEEEEIIEEEGPEEEIIEEVSEEEIITEKLEEEIIEEEENKEEDNVEESEDIVNVTKTKERKSPTKKTNMVERIGSNKYLEGNNKIIYRNNRNG